MKTTLLATTILPFMASAAALVERAGGPTAKPIPPQCTVINPLPHASCGTANVNGMKPNPDFVNANLLYQAYYEASGTPESQAIECKRQCYGYGNLGECKSSFLAYKVPVPAGYEGSSGGQLETGCLLFKDYLTPNDFIAVNAAHYQSETAANIYCPS